MADSARAAAGSEDVVPDIVIRSSRVIAMGPLTLNVRSNEPRFSGFRFFSFSTDEEPNAAVSRPTPDFIVTLCDMHVDGPWQMERIAKLRDRSYRAGRMAAGYYLTDHFGKPAYLYSRDNELLIFAEDFTGILWPYVVKWLLTIYSLKQRILHIKAAAIRVNGRGVLLIGRGGSGKTVLLTQLCKAGAFFLSNTHCLVSDDLIWGISSALRVRKDPFFSPIISERQLPQSIKPGEFIADPQTDMDWQSAKFAAPSAICLLDYRPGGVRRIETLDRATMFDYMEQFALALNVYGLKEDILDYLGRDVRRFSEAATLMRTQLNALVDKSRCYYISCDAADRSNVESIYALVGGG